jgi:hypothetical protein
MNFSIKRNDLIEWLNVVHKSLIDDGWEFAGFHNRDYNMVKIRKKYEENEFQFNEDGYKYQSLFPSVMNTKDYLFFKSKGYSIEVTF